MADEGNGNGGGVAARPGPRGSVERKRGSRRSLWAAQGNEGETMAAVVLVGGGGRVR